jgi:hypothetical protein
LSLDTHVSGNDVVMNNWQTATVAPTNLTSASESVIKQIGAVSVFAWCGRATLTLVLENILCNGTTAQKRWDARYAARAAEGGGDQLDL